MTTYLFDNSVTLESGRAVEPITCSSGKLCTVNKKPSQKVGQKEKNGDQNISKLECMQSAPPPWHERRRDRNIDLPIGDA